MPQTTLSSLQTRAAGGWSGGLCLLGLLALVFSIGCGGDVQSRMAEVRALQDVGQFQESIDQLREILAVAPDLPEANYRLGVALVQTGEPSRAVWALQKASESSEFAIVAGLVLANTHFSISNHEEAIRAADRVLEAEPDRVAALQIRSRALLGVHRLDDALVDSERLVEMLPDDLQARLIHATVLSSLKRLEEAETANNLVKEMGAESDDPEVAARSCLAPAMFAKDDLRDGDKAEALYLDCVETYPTDAFIISQTMNVLDTREKPEKATELIRTAVEKAPENLSLRSSLANRLRSQGQADEAEAVLLEAAETFGSATAWNLLATFYRRQHEPEKALGAVEKVIELTGGGGDQLRFTKADLLVDLERYDEATEVLKTLDARTYATLVEGRILLRRGQSEEALAAFDKGIRHWPNNPGARFLAGLAARDLGDFDRAVTELREAVRADPKATSAALVLANLYFDQGEYKEAVSFASIAGRRDREDPTPYLVTIRSFTALGQYEKARKTAARLEEMGAHAEAVTELSAIAEAESGTEAAIEVVEESDLDFSDAENETALRSYVDLLAKAKRNDRALSRIDAILEEASDRASLHGLRGNVLIRADRDEEARTAFERAVELDAENAEAQAGFATLAGRADQYAEAVGYYDRAAELDPNTPSYAYSAAQLALMQGDREDSEKRLREIVRRYPGETDARNDLAWILAEQGNDLDLALSLASHASRVDPSPEMLDTLGYVQLKRGEAATAVRTFEQALNAGDSPSIRYRLALALAEAGEVERAREMFQAALDAGSTFPEADAARRQLAQLDQP